jgi:hypothetical protein
MIDELKQILGREGITTAVIVDDVFDDIPTAKDVDDESWGFFLDDAADPEMTIIREYGVSDPELRWQELRNDDNFISFLWDRRVDSAVFRALFRTFENRQAGGREQLKPLRDVLFEQLKLQGGAFGSRQHDAGAQAQLLFVDLFLGERQDDIARNKALERVKTIVDPRRDSPPAIVLMSSSTRLQTMREDFRDEAGLIGCQFRTVQKVDLSESEEIEDLLYDLTPSYKNSLQLSQFLQLWQLALQDATTRFLRNVRRLDLRDYADLQTLVLAAEGELIGSYFLEVFGQYFEFELEEDTRLSTAALKLNEMHWEDYPAPNFLPSAVSSSIADGMLFRSAKLLSKDEGLQFGDVLFSTRIDALGEGAEPNANFAKGERIALVLLTAACDIQHGNSKRYLLIAGVARPSELIFHKKPSAELTPVLFHNGKHYVVQWDLGAPVSLTPSELKGHLKSGSFERVRRFRSLFSLQLQQLFTSSLSRVGTPVMPPVQHLCGLTISVLDQAGDLKPLLAASREERKALVLVGRSEKEVVDSLMLAPDIVKDLRKAMQAFDVTLIAEKLREKWKVAVRNRELYLKMKQGFRFDRRGFSRAFAGSAYDIVSVLGPYVDKGKNPITADRKLKGDHGPLIIELNLDDA